MLEINYTWIQMGASPAILEDHVWHDNLVDFDIITYL
jgi:hypothetical protein